MPGRLEPEPVPRRDFLNLAGLGTAAIALLASVIGMVRLPKPRVSPEAASRFRAGKPAEFPPGTVKVFSDQKVRVHATDQGVAAVSLVCTHLGCIVGESPEGFLCPCHGSRFNHDGDVIGGPAPRGLRWLEVSQAPDGTLVIDTATEAQPGEYYTA